MKVLERQDPGIRRGLRSDPAGASRITALLRAGQASRPQVLNKKTPAFAEVFVVIPLGLEPRTPTLKVLCSTS